MKKSNISFIVSSILLILVIIFIVTSKKRDEGVNSAIAQTISPIVYEAGINRDEGIILSMFLEANLNYSSDKLSDFENVDCLRHLKDHFIKTNLHIESNKFDELKILIENLKSIVALENESNIRKMTMQSRTLALHNMESIYKICGLNMEYTIDGIILQIDNINHIYYTNRNLNNSNELQYPSLIVVVGVIVLLYINCFIIVKKNRLYIKGVEYDELNEKGFA